MRGAGLELGVELGVGGGGGPEGVDGLAEDGAGEEGMGVVEGREADEAVGGLCGEWVSRLGRRESGRGRGSLAVGGLGQRDVMDEKRSR